MIENVANELKDYFENVEVQNETIYIKNHPSKRNKATSKQVAYLQNLVGYYNKSSLMGLTVEQASILIDTANNGIEIYIENK